MKVVPTPFIKETPGPAYAPSTEGEWLMCPFCAGCYSEKDFKRGNTNMSASTQRMIREGQHANEMKGAESAPNVGGGVLDPTSKGRLPRQREHSENPFTMSLLFTIGRVSLHPLHQTYYTWCFMVPVPHEKTCSEQ